MSDRLTCDARRGWLARGVATWAALCLLGGAMAGTWRREDPLRVVCSSVEVLCEQWARGGTHALGVRVEMVRMSAGEALSRIERGEGEFDVWHGGPADLYQAARAHGLLVPHRSPATDSVPASRRSPDSSWTGVYQGVLGLCANQRVLQRLGVPLPRTWDDLLDPRLAGQVSLPDPRTSGTGYTVLWTQRVRLGSDAAAIGWFRRLRPNVLQLTRSGMSPSGVAARGEAAVGVSFTQHCLRAHDHGSLDLVTTVPDGPVGTELGAVAVLRGSRHEALGRRYVDFAVGRPAQEMGLEASSGQLPTRPDARSDARMAPPSGRRRVPLDDAAVDHRPVLLELFGREVGA